LIDLPSRTISLLARAPHDYIRINLPAPLTPHGKKPDGDLALEPVIDLSPAADPATAQMVVFEDGLCATE
jgi:hypothetical protein